MKFLRGFALCGALLAGPLAAQTATPWGDEAGCAAVAGEAVLTDSLFILWPDRIERYESACTIAGIDGDLADRATITTECSGEGDTWTSTYRAASVGTFLAIWHQDAPDYVTLLRPCG